MAGKTCARCEERYKAKGWLRRSKVEPGICVGCAHIRRMRRANETVRLSISTK